MNQDYWIQRVEELEHQKKAYFDALVVLLHSQPNKEITVTNALLSTITPSRFMIEQEHDLLAYTVTLKLRELLEYGKENS